jgi:hypothetical protein
MGWWELKPEEQLDAYNCLQLGAKDDLGEEYCDITDIVNFDVDEKYEITEVDIEHITSLIKEGFTSGEINDWDWKSEQEWVVVS